MGLAQEQKSLYNAMVGSGGIRYAALPLAGVAVVDGAPGAWSQLFTAANAPAVDYWLCGFSFSIATGLILAEAEFEFDVGWGGADGAAIAATNIVLNGWPVNFSAVALALGPFAIPNQFLPYPVRIPGGQRMAARVLDSPVGGVAVAAFQVILATVVGN